MSALPTFLVDSREEAERAVAAEIVELLHSYRGIVLGLATGRTPIGVYRELIRAHAAGAATFARSSSFNLDEFVGLEPGHPASFARWMQQHLFDHVDFRAGTHHLPRPAPGDEHACARAYEESIRRAGGIDLQILGIGRNGHIGFNEPGSERDTRTRAVELHADTRGDAAATFGGLDRVPVRAITMGVATILDARRIRVMAFGAEKAAIVRRTLLDPVSSACPATYLRGHHDAVLYVDGEAAAHLLAQ